MTDVRIPDDIWEDDAEGVIVSWLYQDGAVVGEGKLIAELALEKAQLELNAPVGGRLTILCPAETVVKKGQVIARID